MPFDAEHFAPVRLLDRDPKSLTDPRERLEYLRDFLRELPAERFDMQSWGRSAGGATLRGAQQMAECGTKGCICGWTIHLFSKNPEAFLGDIFEAGDALDITYLQATALFEPIIGHRDEGFSVFRDATPAQAANVLDHLLKTGEVDWSVA